MNKTIITVVGKDTVGIIARVCTYLAENKRFTVELDGIRYSMCQMTRYVIQEDGCSATVACRLECLVNQLQAVS